MSYLSLFFFGDYDMVLTASPLCDIHLPFDYASSLNMFKKITYIYNFRCSFSSMLFLLLRAVILFQLMMCSVTLSILPVQSAGVQGALMCGKKPAEHIKVKLFSAGKSNCFLLWFRDRRIVIMKLFKMEYFKNFIVYRWFNIFFFLATVKILVLILQIRFCCFKPVGRKIWQLTFLQ